MGFCSKGPPPPPPDPEPGARGDQCRQRGPAEPDAPQVERRGTEHHPGTEAHHRVVSHLVVEHDAVEQSEGAPVAAGEVPRPHQAADDPRRGCDEVERGRGHEDEEAQERTRGVPQGAAGRQPEAPVPQPVAGQQQGDAERHVPRFGCGHPLGQLGPGEIGMGEKAVGEVPCKEDHRHLERAESPGAKAGLRIGRGGAHRFGGIGSLRAGAKGYQQGWGLLGIDGGPGIGNA